MEQKNEAKVGGVGNTVEQYNIVNNNAETPIKPLSSFTTRFKEQYDFISCEKLTDAIPIIRDSEDDYAIVAMSGMGKTRLIYETFKNASLNNAYYCPSSDGASFASSLSVFFQDESHTEGLLILDNCPDSIITLAISLRQLYGSNMRLIFVNHDYYDQVKHPGVVLFVFESTDTKESVNNFIEKEIYHREEDRFICESIKNLSDGYPYMAILLVDAYKRNGTVNVEDVEFLIKKILGNNSEETLNVLKCLALFQPLGVKPPHQQLDTILKSDVLTGIDKDENKRADLFDKIIDHFRGEIIEESSGWLTVRPLPLAIWLVGEWLKDHSDRSLAKVINAFQAESEKVSASLGSAMVKRLRYMEGNDKAEYLIAELLKRYENSPFGIEEIVCSEFGSRLFLGFAHVNPAATARYLRVVLEAQSISFIREKISGNIRRNLVWSLEKLCFKRDSFRDGIEALTMLALAENEDVGNNATGILGQLFHIMLPGTQATLAERMEYLAYLANKEEHYLPLLLVCVKNAFLAGGFSRMGGVEEFGTNRLTDYQPETNQEIYEYWDKCCTLIIETLDCHKSLLPEIKKLVEHCSYQLLHRDCVNIVISMVEAVYGQLDQDWNEMYTTLYKVNNHLAGNFKEEEQVLLSSWIEKLRPKSFNNELKEVRLTVFDNYRLSHEKQLMMANEMLKPLAKRFVEEKIYDDIDQIQALVEDKEYFDFGFASLLDVNLTEEQLKILLRNLLTIMSSKGDGYTSPFHYHFCRQFYKKPVFGEYLTSLLKMGHKVSYVRVLANNEDEELNVFARILKEIQDNVIGPESMGDYFGNAGFMTNDMLKEVIGECNAKGLSTANELVRFVLRFQFGRVFSEDSELFDMVKQLTLDYQYDEKTPTLNWEYADFVSRALENQGDDGYAVDMNRKMIELLNMQYTHSNFERIFTALLNYHFDAIWLEFSACFVSKDYVRFYYQVSNEVGSGFGFGVGPMYQHGEEPIKELCKKYPETAPYCVAHTAPVFAYEPDGSGGEVKKDRFSSIIIWLLENYGDNETVFDGLNGNIGTFSWTGSPYPLYQSEKNCFLALLDNPDMGVKVKEWAKSHIKDLDELMKQEQSRIDYERMHFQ